MYEAAGDIAKALLSYQRALDLKPSDYQNHFCYGKCLYQSAQALASEAKKPTLQKAKRLVNRAATFGGEQKKQDTDGVLFLIDEALQELTEA